MTNAFDSIIAHLGSMLTPKPRPATGLQPAGQQLPLAAPTGLSRINGALPRQLTPFERAEQGLDIIPARIRKPTGNIGVRG